MVADKTIKRPALRYYGGKWNLAPWIISHFPPHKNYVEPCGGAASVLLQKPRSPLETYNDLDGNVVNFFRVLRDCPGELIRAIELTPWARAEYEQSLTPAGDSTEQARQLFIKLWMSVSGGTGTKNKAWKSEISRDGRYTMPADQKADIQQGLYAIAERFNGVQVDCRPALEVIKKYDTQEGLIYFDPPYVTETRAEGNTYALEWTDKDHREAAGLLLSARAFVVVSGYACPLYADLYEAHGWKRVDRMAQTNSGGKRVESLWLNPRTWAAQSQQMLFGEMKS